MSGLLSECIHTQKSALNHAYEQDKQRTAIHEQESGTGAGLPQRLPHIPGQRCHLLVPAHASALQQCMPQPVVNAGGATQCDATLCISLFLLHCSCIGKRVPPQRVRLKQKKLKGHTMRPRHKGILLAFDIRPHTETFNVAVTAEMLQKRVNRCKVTVHYQTA